ncbi:acyl-CoA N-acyltransferase [Lenzites betulinus]|nr:acyl-CoA N-acyltransferase [Lenzites betulinus]
MSATKVSVRRMTDPSEEDIEMVVQVLMNAFRDDVGLQSFSGGSARLARDVFRRTTKGCVAHGAIYLGLIDNVPHGVALLVAPGADWNFYQESDFAEGLSTYLFEWYTYHYMPTYEELYRISLPSGQRGRRDAWNIKFLAVNPDFQRKGVGRALLGAICKQADADAVCVTADVKSPNLVQWFRKRGFSHRGVKNFSSKDSAGFPLWCTVREPVRPGN